MDEQEEKQDGSQISHTQPEGADLNVPDGDRQTAVSQANDDGVIDEAGSAHQGFQLFPEDLPTLQWADIDAEMAKFEAQQRETSTPIKSTRDDVNKSTGRSVSDAEEAMSWLEELAADEGIPIEEMPTMISTYPIDKQQSSTLGGADAPPSASKIPFNADSDPMAWLEQLAVDQSSPLEELPSVADRLLASDIPAQIELAPNSTLNSPNEIERVIRYLEKLAESRGIDLSQVSFEPQQGQEELEDTLTALDRLAAAGLAVAGPGYASEPARSTGDSSTELRLTTEPEPLPAEPEKISYEMPDDPMEALSWLSALGQADNAVSTDIIDEEDTLGDNKEASARSEEESWQPDDPDYEPVEPRFESQADVAVLEQMPEDPDEAVAWMKTLAQHPSKPAETSAEAEDKVEAGGPTGDDPDHSPNETVSQAERALREGDNEKAFDLYQSILENESVDDETISSLERALAQRSDSPRLMRLLGDAYMQIGEVDKAVSVYRKGFDHL